MSLALLFPGQGVQHVGMLPWLESELACADILAQLEERLGHGWRARTADDAWACSNRIAQPLITGVGLAAWAGVAARLPAPTIVAGYSVGELAAISVAGVIDATAAMNLAQLRALAMDKCAEGPSQGLTAMSGCNDAEIDALCAAFDLSVAIRIGPASCVVGGALAGLEGAEFAVIGRNVKTTRLRVRLASHTPLMQAASDELRLLLAPMAWQKSHCIVVGNLDGQGRRDPLSLKDALARQADHTLRWDLCMEAVAQRQPRCVLEVGPGDSLSRMWSAAYPDIPSRSVDDFRSPEAVADWVLRQIA